VKKRTLKGPKRKQARSDFMGSPLTVGFYMEGPLGRVTMEKRGITDAQIESFGERVARLAQHPCVLEALRNAQKPRGKKRP